MSSLRFGIRIGRGTLKAGTAATEPHHFLARSSRGREKPARFLPAPVSGCFRPPLAGCAVDATLRGLTGSAYCGTILVWPSGEIGRHSRLKICRRQLRVGSSPTSATIYISHSEIFSSKIHPYHLHSARHLKAESSLVASEIGTANRLC
jgi:hypothetical protein